ncbi:MAG: acyl carrier protein [Lachnospira sp.]|nr:acyl carrier protein [Lachnospira sp.]
MDELIDILKNLHADVDYEKCTALIDDKILDSFDLITMIADIHEKFDVIIPADEIIAQNFNSAKSIYSLIERLLDDEE